MSNARRPRRTPPVHVRRGQDGYGPAPIPIDRTEDADVRIALTGAAGDLASGLLRSLDPEHDVVPVDRRPVEHPAARQVELEDLERLTAAFDGCEALVHFAAEPDVLTPWEPLLA